MSALWFVLRTLWRDRQRAFLRGAALGLAVLAMGVALLGLSGWFITAAAAAGLAGTGAVFDVFRPSAGVRFLALGRAAARYGERLSTHDATLRALEALRLRLLDGMMAAPLHRMARLRGAQALNRLTADIDALDGVPLRLALPLAAGLAAQLAAFVALWLLAGPAVATWGLVAWLAGGATIFALAARRAVPLARRGEAATQAFRSRLIDLVRARRDLAVYGSLQAQAGTVRAAEARRRALRSTLDRVERRSGAALSALGALVVAGALWLGLAGAAAGTVTPAIAALGIFAMLALAETLAPLRRAAADLGRMADAARRVRRDLGRTPAGADAPPARSVAAPAPPAPHGPVLAVRGLALAAPGVGRAVVARLDLSLWPGETLALTGPSGSGKSTVLFACAGLWPATAGRITLHGRALADWPEPALRDRLTLVPQRAALIAGTVAEALRLAAPDATDAALWRALEAVDLAAVLHARGGLDLRLGPRGEGLSGGEGRRLVLARALLRDPEVLLLDEPTEGLDAATAAAVLAGLRAALPRAAILMASHRAAETATAHRTLALQ